MRGDRLREIRAKRGLSQRELAQRCDLGEQQIWRYENNETDPSGAIVMRIAKELEITTDYLLGLVDEPTDHLSTNDLTPAEWRLVQAYRNGDLGHLLDMAKHLAAQSSSEDKA